MTDPSDDTLEQFCFHLARHDVQAALSVIEHVAGIATMSDEFGTTALISACEHAELPVIELLCRRGADVNARAETGETPLVNVVRAARFGDAPDPVGCARLLLAHGADPDRLVYDGTNALHQAIIHSQLDLVRLLLASGADPAVRLDDGSSQEDAFELARSGRPRGDAQARQAIVDALSGVRAMSSFLHVPSLVMAKLSEAPDHDVLPGSQRYDLRKLNFLWGHGSDEDRVLDLELSTHDDHACLRFVGVKDLAIPSGDLISAMSIRILDTGHFLPEMSAAIRVEHPAGGGLCFWADAVTRLR